MKVAHVIMSCSPGGAEVFVKSLIKELINFDTKIELWVMTKLSESNLFSDKRKRFEQNFVNELENIGIKVRFIDENPTNDWKKKLRVFFWKKVSSKILDFYNDFKPDIVHAHLESVTFHVCRTLKKKNVKIFQTIHSIKIVHRFIQRFYFVKNIDHIIAISNKLRNKIVNDLNFKKEKVTVIYNGVSLSDFKIKERVIKEDVNLIVAIGRLTLAKDHDNLIEAYHILKRKYIEIDRTLPQLWIVGDGEMKKALIKKVNDLSLDKEIIFKGIRNDITEILKKADIYVMSSAWEGLSISLIEALASGIPVIATNVGSNDEIIDDNVNGLLVPKKNPELFANSLNGLINNYKLRKKFSKNAIEKSKKFSIEKCAKKHYQIYLHLLEDKKKC